MNLSRSLRSLSALLSISLLATLGLGCGAEEEVFNPAYHQFEFPIEVEAKDSADNPVAGVPVVLDGNVVGYTGADGLFEGILWEYGETEVTLAVREPEGYRLVSGQEKTEHLRITEGLDGYLRGLAVTLRPELQSVQTEYMAWVQISCDQYLDDKHCKDRPVLLDGQEIARTDEHGQARVTFIGVPDTKATLSIRTPVHDPSAEDSVWMFPPNPNYPIELGYDATIFRVNQEFSDPAEQRAQERRPTRRVRRAAPRQTQQQRQRQQQQQQQQQQEEERPSRGPIPLF